jgi:predicted DNA-binding transcriptional regulator YafY
VGYAARRMQRVIERILNLLAYLLTVGRPVTAEEIRNTVAGYEQESDAAFHRTFERDKDLLRRLGVPLKLDFTDRWEVEEGYVVSPQEYAMPDPGLTEEERVALTIALRMVRLGGETPGEAGLFKLGGLGTGGADGPFAAHLDATPDLPVVFTAVVERRFLTFDYRGSARSVHPLGLVHRNGHWYLIADLTDGGRRAFRVDRMSRVEAGEKPGAFDRPKGFKAGDAVADAPWEAGADDLRVSIAFDPSVAWWARRQLTSSAEVTDSAEGGIRVTLPVRSQPALFSWLIGFDDHAEILEPPEVVEAFVSHVSGAA